MGYTTKRGTVEALSVMKTFFHRAMCSMRSPGLIEDLDHFGHTNPPVPGQEWDKKSQEKIMLTSRGSMTGREDSIFPRSVI